MRKLTIIIASAAIAATSSAQLKVASNGQIRVGDDKGMTTSLITPAAIGVDPGVGVVVPNRFPNDTTSTIHVGGKGTYDSGGLISFGYRGHVSIGESEYDSSAVNGDGVLELVGKGGVTYTSGDNTIFSYNPTLRIVGSSSRSSFIFQPSVSAPQYLTTSDARCKTDIEPLEDMGSQLRDIVPVSYTLVQETGAENQDAPAGAPRKSGAQQNAQHQYGFLAQDVREVYPELVYEDSEGMLSIDYTGFIPILVDAIQNLQSTVEAQAATIEALQNKDQEAVPGNGSVVASLSQNRPNPFRTSTVISCVLPDEVSQAFLCVYDLNGNQKMRRDIPQRGSVDITIEGNTLTAGMYIYTLIADGLEIDSKRMILTD